LYEGEYLECVRDPRLNGSRYRACVGKRSTGYLAIDPAEEVIITDKAEYVQELMEGFSLCGS
jgi:hypothetical protein